MRASGRAGTGRNGARRTAHGARRTAWNAAFDGYCKSAADPILTQPMGGETLAAICAAPGMPSVGTVYNWLRRYPEFLKRYRRAWAWAPEIMVRDACEHLPWEGEANPM